MATYYDKQIERLWGDKPREPVYLLKMHGGYGATNWINITVKQVEAIRKILNDGAADKAMAEKLRELNGN